MPSSLINRVREACGNVLGSNKTKAQELKNPEQLYDETCQIARKIFYSIFEGKRYDIRTPNNVMGTHEAFRKNGDGYVHLTVWNCPGARPRISVLDTSDNVQEDARKLANDIEKRTAGYISWECKFPRQKLRN